MARLFMMDDISFYFSDGYLKIVVKTNCPKTEITSYDQAKKALKVNVKAPPVDGKANLEVVKFFSKQLRRPVVIKSGTKCREKLLKLV